MEIVWNYFKNSQELQMIFQIILAAILGGLIGFEREKAGKAAGFRTYMLVCVGTTLFTMLSVFGFSQFGGTDPSRVAAQIVTGIGFIGAGLIIFREGHVEGLTSAAGFWAIAAIGMAIGVRFYLIAIFSALFVLFLLTGIVKILELKFHKTPPM